MAPTTGEPTSGSTWKEGPAAQPPGHGGTLLLRPLAAHGSCPRDVTAGWADGFVCKHSCGISAGLVITVLCGQRGHRSHRVSEAADSVVAEGVRTCPSASGRLSGGVPVAPPDPPSSWALGLHCCPPVSRCLSHARGPVCSGVPEGGPHLQLTWHCGFTPQSGAHPALLGPWVQAHALPPLAGCSRQLASLRPFSLFRLGGK